MQQQEGPLTTPDEIDGSSTPVDCLSHRALARIADVPEGGCLVVAQLGQSLDGRIATPTGDSRYINRAAALDHLHRLRAAVDAVVVGVGTVIADDPQLTVRRVAGRNPTRVVLDPRGRLPPDAHCITSPDARRLVVGGASAPRPAGVEEVVLPLAGGRLDPHAIVAALAARGLRRLLIEGGARTISAFLDAGCIDRLHLLVAPIIIGSGRAGLELQPIGPLSEALRPATDIYLLADGDVLFDCDMRRRNVEACLVAETDARGLRPDG